MIFAYISSTVFLPPPSPVLANIHLILAYDVPGTEDVSLPTKLWFNAGPSLQPIAGSMPGNRLRRWPNNNPSQGLLYILRKHVVFTQYCFNVDPQSSTLASHWNSIDWLYRVFCCIIRVTIYSLYQKHQITRYIPQCWSNAGTPSATLDHYYSNQNPLSS